MIKDADSRVRRWAIGAAALVAVGGGLLFLILGGFTGDSTRSQEAETSTRGPTVVTLIVDGMMKSQSGAT